jgi:hypothetical protein
MSMPRLSASVYDEIETIISAYTPSHPAPHPYPQLDFGVHDPGHPLEEASVERGEMVRVVKVLEGGEWVEIEKMKQGDVKGKGKARCSSVIPRDCLRRLGSS